MREIEDSCVSTSIVINHSWPGTRRQDPIHTNLFTLNINLSCSNLPVAHQDQLHTHLFVSTKGSYDAPSGDLSGELAAVYQIAHE
jgi:hypothetical protein